MKKCTKCKLKKEESDFVKSKTTKDGLSSYCKSCMSKYSRERRLKNPTPATLRLNHSKELAEKLLLKGQKRCYICDTIKPTDLFYTNVKAKDGYMVKCKTCQRNYEVNKRDIRREEREKYKKETKNIREAMRKEWEKNYYIKNKEKFKKLYELNKTKLNKQKTKNHKKRYHTDSLYRLSSNIRSRTSNAFRKTRWNKDSSNESILGCSFKEACGYLENQFTNDMSWSNKNKWHVDHIIPLSSAVNKEELMTLCNYQNLQPLWAKDNLEKSDKYNEIDKVNMIKKIKDSLIQKVSQVIEK